MDDLIMLIKFLLVVLAAVVIGGAIGVIWRVTMVHGSSNGQVLDSSSGLIVVLAILFGFYNLVKSFKPINPYRGLLGAAVIGLCIAWVAPLPF